MALDVGQLALDFARGIAAADARRPIAVNARSKAAYGAGIGPHCEAAMVQLVMAEAAAASPERYADRATNVAYPDSPRQRCDLCLGTPSRWSWAIEVKLLRFLGDNGRPNDNMVMHVLSPYAEHRSALTDCSKLATSSVAPRKAIIIYGFSSREWPLEPLVEAFEVLARLRARLGNRVSAPFEGLVHPVHAAGVVFGWELT